MTLAADRVEECKPRQDAAHFQVQRPVPHPWVEGDLPDDVLMRVGRGVVPRAGIQLGTVRRGEVLGQRDRPEPLAPPANCSEASTDTPRWIPSLG